MNRLYKKNELWFALSWIIAYVVLFSMAENFSAVLGVEKIISAPVCVVFTLLLFGWVKRNGLMETYGLHPFRGSRKEYLYFLPLLLLMTFNLWNGVTMNRSVIETALYVFSMLCVGFIEEVIFRGLLFKALCKDGVKQAVVISSITFGLGHIVNLLNGANLLPTLLQVCYATAIGFLFTILFYKGGSLFPCILVHSVINATSIFAVPDSLTFSLVRDAVMCVVSIGYALYIVKGIKREEGR